MAGRKPAGSGAGQPSAASPSSNDLLIVGPGVLGSYLGKLWLEEHGPGTVTGQTNSTANHGRLLQLGFAVRTTQQAAAEAAEAAAAAAKSAAAEAAAAAKAEGGDGAEPAAASPQQGRKPTAGGAGPRSFANVAFCAPPSGSQDYVGDIKAALALWDGTGSFVFTSSAAVYQVDTRQPACAAAAADSRPRQAAAVSDAPPRPSSPPLPNESPARWTMALAVMSLRHLQRRGARWSWWSWWGVWVGGGRWGGAHVRARRRVRTQGQDLVAPCCRVGEM